MKRENKDKKIELIMGEAGYVWEAGGDKKSSFNFAVNLKWLLKSHTCTLESNNTVNKLYFSQKSQTHSHT